MTLPGLGLMEPLPPEALRVLQVLRAQPRLLAHARVVHDTAGLLSAALDRAWPGLPYDHEAALLGAALHDAGKARYPYELTGTGRRHENEGPALLRALGVPERVARFARTHGQWAHEYEPPLEDLLVALADTIWKGKRNERLENLIVDRLAAFARQERWEVFMKLDDILQALALDADARLAWTAEHPVSGEPEST